MAEWYNKLTDAVKNTDNKNESVNENRKYAIVDGVYMKNNEIRKTALRHMRAAYHMLPEYLTYGLGKLQGLVEETILPNKNEKDIFTYTHDDKTIFSQNINRKYLSFLSDDKINNLRPEDVTSLSKGSYTAWGGKYKGNIYPYEDLSDDTHKEIKSKLYEFTIEEIGNEKYESNPFRYIREKNEEKWFNKDKPYAVDTYNVDEGKAYLKQLYQNYEIFDEGDTSGSTGYTMDLGNNKYIDPTESHSTTPNLKYKTIKLFNEHKIDTMVSRFSLGNNKEPEFIDSTISKNHGNSHGRSLLAAKNAKTEVDGYNRPFCRTWTNKYQYDNVNKLIRGVSGETNEYWNSVHGDNTTSLKNKSVLSNNGFVRITPSSTAETDLTKCMFSIENLAWKDVLLVNCLTPEQRGPNGGRIMWFPPYDLSFQETANVTWNENRFIGRGESIYTYTNTMRSGTLGFTLLIDHPSILNKAVRGSNDTEELEMDILRFFAGEGELEVKKDPNRNQGDNNEVQPQTEPYSIANNDSNEIKFKIYFPYKYSGNVKFGNGNIIDEYDKDAFRYLTNEYEVSSKGKLNTDEKKSIQCYDYLGDLTLYKYEYRIDDDKIKCFSNVNNFYYNGTDKLNENFKIILNDFNNSNDKIYDSLFSSKSVRIDIKTSSDDYEDKDMNKKRGYLVETLLKDIFNTRGKYSPVIVQETNQIQKETPNQETDSLNVNSKENKEKRYVEVTITYNKPEVISFFPNKERIETNNSRKFNGSNVVTTSATTSGSADNKYYSEFDYFADIAKKQDFAYESIKDKVTYFNPAYHSLTPEGFNERLNFLHQCTRQGHTIENNNDKFKTAGNLAFGRPPICVLRIGDFINTKIIIDSLTIQYDNRGIQWDLNHDGIGVQPMYAKVNMGIKIIGGQSLEGPVANLNNAVSFNYYANTGVYDKRAHVGKRDDKYISTWSVNPKKREPK